MYSLLEELDHIMNKNIGIKSIQRGTTTLSEKSSIEITINSVTPNKCLVIVNSLTNNSIYLQSNSWEHVSSGEYYSLEAKKLTVNTVYEATVSWQVIEFY